MTNLGHKTIPADARRRQIRAMQLVFAGAASVAALALFSAAPDAAGSAVAAGPQSPQIATSVSGAGGDVIAVDDDTNPSSGDIFTQNAEDQSTANGAGT
jgi:hypothetical protein